MEVNSGEKEPIIIKVDKVGAGIRIDKFLSEKLSNLSITRSTIQKLINEGHILLNSKRIKQSVKVNTDDIISVFIPEREQIALMPEKKELDIIYEDRSIIVINKPAGMVVHPAPGHNTGSLVNALIAYTDQLSKVGAPLRPGIVHRLDKDTSGVMVIARNDRAHYNLTAQFLNREVKKRYICLVYGIVQKDSGRVEKIIGRSEHNRKKFTTRSKRGRYSITEWKVIERFKNWTLLQVYPLTGRTHQIRVHLSDINHPILGDRIYGGKRALKMPENINSDHLYLHSEYIGFRHPENGNFVEFFAPLPDYFEKAIEHLRNRDV